MFSYKPTQPSRRWLLSSLSVGLALVMALSMTFADDADAKKKKKKRRTPVVVVAPPETTIDSGPTGIVSSDSARFTFSSSQQNSSFECSLDGAPLAGCTSPKEYTGLADGPHTFEVRAKNATGQTDTTPASRTFTVDTTAPTIGSISPANAATNVGLSTIMEANFSEAMDQSSISDQSFTLSNNGSPVAAHVSYDSTTKKATLNPDSDLEENTTYEATITKAVKDKAGNALAQDYTWSFETIPHNVAVTPATLNWSSAEIGPWCSRIDKNLTLKNNGSADVTFAEANITGPDASHFYEGVNYYISKNGPYTLSAGSQVESVVTFVPGSSPTDRSRSYSATLTYKDATGATIGTQVTFAAKTGCLNVG